MPGTLFCDLTEPAGEGLEVLPPVILLALEMDYLVRIPFPRLPRPLPRLDLRPRLFGPDSGGHCGFEITNERATRRKSMLKTFSQYLTIHEENRSRCFPFQL